MAFSSGEEAKNRFSRWRPWWPSWISDWQEFSYFLSTSHPDASYQVSSQLAQGCRRSRLLKQLLMPHDGRHTTDDGHWLTTIAHHEHFVLRWAINTGGFSNRHIKIAKIIPIGNPRWPPWMPSWKSILNFFWTERTIDSKLGRDYQGDF